MDLNWAAGWPLIFNPKQRTPHHDQTAPVSGSWFRTPNANPVFALPFTFYLEDRFLLFSSGTGSMSTPTGQLSGLSIRGSRKREKDVETETETEVDSDSESESGTESGSEGTSGTETQPEPLLRPELGRNQECSTMTRTDLTAVTASSGLVYDLHNSGFDPETEARALLGLTAIFEILLCGPKAGGYYEFVFAEGVRVQLALGGSRRFEGGSNEGAVWVGTGNSCTCAVFQARRDVACHHIFVSLP